MRPLTDYQAKLLEFAASEPDGRVYAPEKAVTAQGGSSNASYSRVCGLLEEYGYLDVARYVTAAGWEALAAYRQARGLPNVERPS